MKYIRTAIAILCAIIATNSIQAQAADPTGAVRARIKEEEVTYDADGVKMKSYIAYIPNPKHKLPVVLILPEWWGCGDYVKMRARMLAALGYVAMAVDMYGGGAYAATVEDAKKLSGELYKDPRLAKTRIQAAEKRIGSYQQVDKNKIAAIGYCFGGSMVLDAARMGMNFRGVVSFHGGLEGTPATRGAVKGKILICNGGADKGVTEQEIKAFKTNLDTLGVKYLFRTYPGATHAFSNPAATANGKKFNLPIAYNEEADKQSWEEMRKFLLNIFNAR